jgi:hypothetical protein
MKKVLVLFVAVLLAIPAVTYAGSATSRWDVTIGGFVKADFGYADQGVSADSMNANRKSGTSENVYDEYGNYYSSAGEGRLNFLIKGPDAWGAKSTAFVEGDFRGGWGAAASYGLFQLRHAFLKFDWPTSSLVIGQAWQPWGLMPCFCVLNVNELGPFMKGVRQPQITYTQSFTKNFSGVFSLFTPVSTLSTTVGEQVVNSYSKYPQLATEFNFKTDTMGKIGPWMLQFGLGGFIGKQKQPYTDTGTLEAAVSSFTPGGNQQTAAHWRSDNQTVWGAAFKTFVPIIPESKPDQKAGALGFAAVVFTGQGQQVYQGPLAINSYMRGTGADRSIATPVVTGGWAQLFYHLTNTVSVNGQYGQFHSYASRAQRTYAASGVTAAQLAYANQPLDIRHYVLNVIYDPTPAVRLGVEFSRVYTKYYGAGYSATTGATTYQLNGAKDYGAFNSVRVAAYYFF